MRIKNIGILMIFLLNLKIVFGANGPFSLITGGEGIIAAIMKGIGFILDKFVNWQYTPYLAVFFMIFAAMWYLSRKYFFKDEKFKNAAIVFSLALSAVSLYGPFGIVDYVASLSTTSVSLIFLLVFLIVVYIIATELFGKAGESTGKMYKGFEAGSKGVEDYRKASHTRWKGDVDRDIEEDDILEKRGRERTARREREDLRQYTGYINGVITTLQQADNLVPQMLAEFQGPGLNPATVAQFQNQADASCNNVDTLIRNIRNSFPQDIRPLQAANQNFRMSYRNLNNPAQVDPALFNRIQPEIRNLTAALTNVLQALQQTP